MLNNGGTTLGSGTGTVAFVVSTAQTISGTTTFFDNLSFGSNVTSTGSVQV